MHKMKASFYGVAFLIAAILLVSDKPCIHLTGTSRNGMVQLNAKADELNPPFYIEKSFDGENWAVIGKIKEVEGREFSYIDSVPVMGLSFYRIEGSDAAATK